MTPRKCSGSLEAFSRSCEGYRSQLGLQLMSFWFLRSSLSLPWSSSPRRVTPTHQVPQAGWLAAPSPLGAGSWLKQPYIWDADVTTKFDWWRRHYLLWPGPEAGCSGLFFPGAQKTLLLAKYQGTRPLILVQRLALVRRSVFLK